MPYFAFASLRVRALALVLIALLPVFGLFLYSYLDQRNQAILEVQKDALMMARNVAQTQEAINRSAEQLLSTLAIMPQVQSRDPAACAKLFAELLEKNSSYVAILAADPEGQVFANAPAPPRKTNIADRQYFQEAIRARGFVIGESLLGRISSKYSLVFAYPVFDGAGQIKVILAAGLDLRWLSRTIENSRFPATTSLILVNGRGGILYRHPEPEKYVGQVLPEVPIIKTMVTRGEGVTAAYGVGGIFRLFGFSPVAPASRGIYLGVGIPREAAYAEIQRYLRWNLIWLGLITLMSLAVAWVASEIFIQREVNKLLRVTQRLTGGDLAARTGPPYKSGELGLLAQAFDHMADSLQTRDAELKQRVTELDERSDQLEAANKELEAFSYSVSHDLRAPLRGIDGFARALAEDYAAELDEEGKRYLNIIRSETRKMGQLIDDLLTLSRLGRKEMSLTEIDMEKLSRLVFEEIKALAPDREVQINIKPMPRARGDRAMIRQVWMNLLLNAVKFTGTREIATIEVNGWDEDNRHVYMVKDNGVGFDMAYANKLFGVFQRLHREEEFEGTGVGLAIVKRLIHRHGGQVWAEGKLGEGAAFHFTLPK